MHWFLNPILHHYADFKGRAPRKEYWLFMVTYMLTVFPAWVLSVAIMIATTTPSSDLSGGMMGVVGVGFMIATLVIFASIIPVIALHVRRFHDIGYSGLWYLLGLIPYGGGLVVLILMCLPSQEGTNKYGPHPYAVAEPLPPEPVPAPPMVPPMA